LPLYPFWKPGQIVHLENRIFNGDELSELFASEDFEEIIRQVSYDINPAIKYVAMPHKRFSGV
jgi:hypothetical protein